MTVILDMICSTIVAGYIILLGLRLNNDLVNTTTTSTTNANVQESMVDVISVLESDFRKIGFNVPDPKNSIAIADSNQMRFRADMNHDGIVDSVEWYVGNVIVKSGDLSVRVLYKRYNGGTPAVMAHGITDFKLKYLDQDGVQTSVLSKIWIIETTLSVSSYYKVADQVNPDISKYASVMWRQTRLASRNIKRHG